MDSFYTPQALAAMKQRKKAAGLLCLGIGLAGLIACIVMCCLVCTANARQMLIATVAVSALSGWSVTLLRRWLYAPLRANCDHMAGVLKDMEDPEQVTEAEGTLSVSSMAFPIPRSITVRKVTIHGEAGDVSCRVDDRLARRLPASDTRVRVTLVRGYVTGVEAR